MLSPVVLVPEGQSGQDYRLCCSYVGLNSKTAAPFWPAPDTQSVIDALYNATAMSQIDLKAGFWNIPVAPESIALTAIVTQDGVYEALRMQFGFKCAPSHFQKTIIITLDYLMDGQVVVYIDDIVLYGSADNLDELWERTLAAIRKLTSAGFMINVRKSRLMCGRGKVVGVEVENGRYCATDKPLRKLFGTAPPRSLKELQKLLG